uniref:Uncharacterized protein n=1 Tax=Babesia duncani TaxID=323732 RepID=A0A385GNH5_9APIC|nr:hypothetical protein [Babesia duncani]
MNLCNKYNLINFILILLGFLIFRYAAINLNLYLYGPEEKYIDWGIVENIKNLIYDYNNLPLILFLISSIFSILNLIISTYIIIYRIIRYGNIYFLFLYENIESIIVCLLNFSITFIVDFNILQKLY